MRTKILVLISLSASLSAIFSGCASNPVTEDKSFESKRTAEIVPIPVDVDTDLTRVFIKKPPTPPAPARFGGAYGPCSGQPLPPCSGQPFSACPSEPYTACNEAPQAYQCGDPSLQAHQPTSCPRRHSDDSDDSGESGVSENLNAQVDFKPKKDGILRYRVKRTDTLMKIAFSVLGDLRRWKEILDQNPGKIGKLNALDPGTLLTIRVSHAVNVRRNGDPYLIRRRDTLVKISDHLYGTPRKWWALWDNNRELIHNPNRIYAGFTLYYLPNPATRSFTQPFTPSFTPQPLSQSTTSAPESNSAGGRKPAQADMGEEAVAREQKESGAVLPPPGLVTNASNSPVAPTINPVITPTPSLVTRSPETERAPAGDQTPAVAPSEAAGPVAPPSTEPSTEPSLAPSSEPVIETAPSGVSGG